MSVYQHFRKDEHPFVEQALEWLNRVESRYEAKLTEFLDPRQQDILAQLNGDDEVVQLSFFGGVPDAERKRALIYPFYEEDLAERFQIVLYELIYPEKFVTLEHRDVLGTMTGAGIKREKFGDIVMAEGRIQVAAAAEVSAYLEANITQAARAKVTLRPIEFGEALQPEEAWEEADGFVSSLRLDVVLSEIYRLPRGKTAPYIKNGRVKVNWKIVDQPAYQLDSGDHLSVRGLGRSRVFSLGDLSKKGKQHIYYGKKS
ncbi:RNA-binding protein YlmH [Salsuginibacillus halophilus]|uniref:RNA-binding protein YlmH n=1 Tax=Salsuginibacillus halophilus TaxID=517424 RepID=A0A2P8HX16_9BACI|nr:RNA-binding protein [Salsuginibacillus halophilus]PSL50757.1 RNA-binding protein YlmH [Salsuginibacillus halophilus]